MCVGALAWQVHPDWPLILIGNRDEFHDRPSAPLGAWDAGSGIVAGPDLPAGRTWMAVPAPSARVAVVPTVRRPVPHPAQESSRRLGSDRHPGPRRVLSTALANLTHPNTTH